ncbi:hypothetical protein C2S51_005446 [Perilla frutescens var. frutescens]|nr:hypothetical protein C2S51_005446 [Perilla frutescens var. frutescens]
MLDERLSWSERGALMVGFRVAFFSLATFVLHPKMMSFYHHAVLILILEFCVTYTPSCTWGSKPSWNCSSSVVMHKPYRSFPLGVYRTWMMKLSFDTTKPRSSFSGTMNCPHEPLVGAAKLNAEAQWATTRCPEGTSRQSRRRGISSFRAYVKMLVVPKIA